MACDIGPSVNPLQNREIQHVNIVLQCMYPFFEQPKIWKEIMLELNAKPSSVTTSSTDFSFQNLVFWNLFEFSAAEITWKYISPTFWMQIVPNKFHLNFLIKIFLTIPKAHSNSSKNFSYDLISFLVKKSFNVQELLHHKSKQHETNRMHPCSSGTFQKDQEHDLKHPSSVDLISTNKTKQTYYLPS